MSDLNKAQIIGNVGKLDIKTTSNGLVIANLSMATKSRYANQAGEMIDKTEWHNVVFFKKLAEIVQQYVQVGHKLYVEGSIQTDKWTTESGETRYATKIIGSNMQMLTPKSADAQTAPKPAPTQQAKPIPYAFDDQIPF
jgi:single-strand DNA-binding protein